jgi:hypothetical protein
MSKSKQLDDYGYFGPSYSFADNIPLPGQIGVRTESSFGAIFDAVGGVNYYIDTIAFGSPTFFDSQNTAPMGIRYFLNTGQKCSNGATMSEYFDGIPKGTALGSTIANALASAGLPGLKGLGPGMVENAESALDPRPILAAAVGSGYPVCQKVMCPVGDVYGRIQNMQDPTQPPYIIDPVTYVDGKPFQERWVQGYDATGSQISITQDEFGATPKCYNADGSYRDKPPAGCPGSEAAPVAVPGQDPYGLCAITQPVTLPPTVAAGQQQASEGFTLQTQEAERLALAAAVAVLGGIVLWSMSGK